MLKPHTFFPYLFGTKLKYQVNCLQNLRWITGIAAENAAYYDDASLETAKPFKELPSLTSLPVIGTAWVFLPIIGRYEITNFTAALIDKQKLLGNIFREKFGPTEFVVTFNADDLQTMFTHEGAYPRRLEMQTMKLYRESRKQWFKNGGLVLLNGKEWHDLRKKTQKHLMKPRAVLAFLNPMQNVARDFLEKILKERDTNKEMPDFLVELNKWSLESIALVALDSRLGCLEKNLSPDSDGMKMIYCVRTLFECMNKLEPFLGNIPFWKYFPTPTWKKLEKAGDTFSEIAFRNIKQSLDKLKSDDDQDLTLLQSMLLTKGMDLPSTMTLAIDLLGAGIDTTAQTVGFLLYNLAKNPDKQELLYQHIKRILPQKEDRITTDIFNELRYLKYCIKESMRLYPVAGIHMRTADHDVILSGYRIPAGTISFAFVQGIFKDPKYFSNPDEFLPERWLSKDEKFHPFAFQPFGVGPRSCIGRRIAEMEMICLTVELIRNFKIEYHYEDIGTVTRLINVPDKPLRLKFIER